MRGDEAAAPDPKTCRCCIFHTPEPCYSNCQTMFFIKSALKALEMPGRPFLHDVNRQLLEGAGETCSLCDRW